MQLDDTVCYCFHISKRKVLNFIRLHRPRVASQVAECGGAGTGCGWCVPYLKRYFAESQGREAEITSEPTPETYAAGRAAYIRAGKGKPAAGAIPLPPEETPLEE
jgi:bacterioferritin-associated ferredoxin